MYAMMAKITLKVAKTLASINTTWFCGAALALLALTAVLLRPAVPVAARAGAFRTGFFFVALAVAIRGESFPALAGDGDSFVFG